MNDKKIKHCWESIKNIAKHNNNLVCIGTSDDNDTRMIYPYGEPLFTNNTVFFPCKLRKYKHDVEGYMGIAIDRLYKHGEDFACYEFIAELDFYSQEDFEKTTHIPGDIYKRLQN